MQINKFNRTQVYGIAGLSRSGKDTVADLLVNLHKENNICCVKLDMAEPLKNMLSGMFKVPRVDWDNEEIRSKPMPELGGKTPREAMQFFGEVANKFYVDTWTRHLRRSIEYAVAQGWVVVVTGIRHPHQAKMIQDFKGELIYVHRPNLAPEIVETIVWTFGANELSRRLILFLGFFNKELKKYAHTSEFNSFKVAVDSDYLVINDNFNHLEEKVENIVCLGRKI